MKQCPFCNLLLKLWNKKHTYILFKICEIVKEKHEKNQKEGQKDAFSRLHYKAFLTEEGIYEREHHDDRKGSRFSSGRKFYGKGLSGGDAGLPART
jgi:hypothetical protein